MDAFISGAWRTVRRGEVVIGGTSRSVTRAEVYRSGTWRSAVAFTSPMSLFANNVSGIGRNRGKPVSVVSSTSQATPTGGLGPYTYSWTILSGGAVASSPNMAATTFRQTVAADTTEVSTARVTCTDVLGTTATADIGITLINESNL